MKANQFKVGGIYFIDYHMATYKVTDIRKSEDRTLIYYEVLEGSIPGIDFFMANSPFAKDSKLSITH